MARRRPTEEDSLEAIRRLLSGLADGADAHELVLSMADLHPKNNTFPGEAFMGLAADALEAAGAAQHEPIPYEGFARPICPNASSVAVRTARSSLRS
jgi:hypothetical protein